VGRNAVAPQGLALPANLPPVLPADMDAWVNAADGLHPSIRKARLAQEVAKLETDKARAGALPTVDLVAGLNTSNSTGTATIPNSNRGTTTSASLGVQLNMPLYTGGAVQNRIKETVVLEEKARQDLEAARRGVGLGTRSAFLGVQSGLGQVKALEAAEASTKLALEATELGYKVGVRVNLDVLNAQSQLFDTRRDLSKARYDVIVNSLKLRQASGQLQPQDLRAIDALLVR
jgi:outer membrane protein